MNYPIPRLVAAPKRLAALDSYAVLDTPAEAGFDDVVHLACRLCAAPMALVSLVAGDRQWFKARVGFPACETDLNSSVCAHALATPDELLVIPDLTADLRTASNPLVTGEPRIRFYAGAPLVTPEGEAIGSLCVIDSLPRPEGLTETQAEDLKALARQVMTQLELRRATRDRDELLETQWAKLRQAQRLDVIAKASDALVSARDPGAVLEPILAAGATSIGFEQAFIYDLVPDGEHLLMRHSVGIGEDLAPLLRDGVTVWFDGNIEPGAALDRDIARALRNAHVFVALFSSSYLASNYCWNIECRRAIGRRARGLMRVVGVVAKPCGWKQIPAAGFKLLPEDGRPPERWSSLDEAYNDIARGDREGRRLGAARTGGCPGAARPATKTPRPAKELPQAPPKARVARGPKPWARGGAGPAR